jgi:L-ascorbate metabolism protein UlaG (beta-lactamase superfamily)
MHVTWLGHAGLRVDREDYTLVVDPGAFCEKAALDRALADADGVLITHEHFDHFAAEAVGAALAAKPGIEVWTNCAVAALLEGAPATVHTIGDGAAFSAGGIDVHGYGEWHAEIHRDFPIVRNTGFLIGGSVFHPGDALTDPGVPVDVLLLPSHGPWTRTGDLIDYVRQVKPGRVSPIHNAMLSEIGDRGIDMFVGEGNTGSPVVRMALGESFEV